MTRFSQLAFITSLLVVAALTGAVQSAQATVSGGSVTGNTAADLVVATADADYNVSFDTDITADATTTTITFPTGYTITDGAIATSTGICNDACGTAGEITVGGVSHTVSSITGNAAARTIAVELASGTDMSAGAGASFRLTEGITNATTSGTTTTFSITTDAPGETAQNDVPEVVLTPEAAADLVITTQPAGSVSGAALTTQPEIEARDQYGNVDTNFTEVITATEASAGTLENSTTTSVSGVATFAGLTYTATADGENFTLTFNDEDGVGTDLAATSSNTLSAEVVATQLVFTQQPAGAVSGEPLTTQPIVAAQDADNVTDTDFTEVVTLTEASPGTLTNATTAAAAGVATFTNVTYTATADNEAFTLTANDEDGVGSDLPTVDANEITASLVAEGGGGGACLNCGTVAQEDDDEEGDVEEEAAGDDGAPSEVDEPDALADDAEGDAREEPETTDVGRQTDEEQGETEDADAMLIPRERLQELLRRFAPLVAEAPVVQLAPPEVSFTTDLYLGVYHEEVRALQRYLNAHGFQIASEGPGSPGRETTFFGPLTQSALAEFQEAYAIFPAAGYFGPITREFLRSL